MREIQGARRAGLVAAIGFSISALTVVLASSVPVRAEVHDPLKGYGLDGSPIAGREPPAPRAADKPVAESSGKSQGEPARHHPTYASANRIRRIAARQGLRLTAGPTRRGRVAFATAVDAQGRTLQLTINAFNGEIIARKDDTPPTTATASGVPPAPTASSSPAPSAVTTADNDPVAAAKAAAAKALADEAEARRLVAEKAEAARRAQAKVAEAETAARRAALQKAAEERRAQREEARVAGERQRALAAAEARLAEAKAAQARIEADVKQAEARAAAARAAVSGPQTAAVTPAAPAPVAAPATPAPVPAPPAKAPQTSASDMPKEPRPVEKHSEATTNTPPAEAQLTPAPAPAPQAKVATTTNEAAGAIEPKKDEKLEPAPETEAKAAPEAKVEAAPGTPAAVPAPADTAASASPPPDTAGLQKTAPDTAPAAPDAAPAPVAQSGDSQKATEVQKAVDAPIDDTKVAAVKPDAPAPAETGAPASVTGAEAAPTDLSLLSPPEPYTAPTPDEAAALAEKH